MELAWLEDFIALSSVRVFSRAAEARNVSQSAFTRRIQNLERWVGTSLVDRSVHPIALTPAGEMFRESAHEALRALTLARHEVQSLTKRQGELLKFVSLHTLAISFFPHWISEIQRSLGLVKTRVVTEDFSGCVETMLNGSSDFMLSYQHPSVPNVIDKDPYHSVELAVDRVIAVSATNNTGGSLHTITGTGSFPLLAFSTDSFLGRISDSLLQQSGFVSRAVPVYENSVAEALKTACVAGLGVAWIPAIAVKTEIDNGSLVKISDPSQETEVSVRLYRSMERSHRDVERLWTFIQSRAVKPDSFLPGR